MKNTLLTCLLVWAVVTAVPTQLQAQSTHLQDVEIIQQGETIYLGTKIVSEPTTEKQVRTAKPFFKKKKSTPFIVPTLFPQLKLDKIFTTITSFTILSAGAIVIFFMLKHLLLWISADGDESKQAELKTAFVPIAIGTLIVVSGIALQNITFKVLSSRSLLTPLFTQQTALTQQKLIGD